MCFALIVKCFESLKELYKFCIIIIVIIGHVFRVKNSIVIFRIVFDPEFP